MFTKQVVGADGRMYDSKGEAMVLDVLRELEQEGFVSGIIGHPLVAGLEFDFAFSVVWSESPIPTGTIVFLEYDGLGLKRPEDILYKLDRHRSLHNTGLLMRWIFSPTRDDILRSISNEYTRPHIIQKNIICISCGEDRKTHVLCPVSHDPIVKYKLCKNCKEND